MERRQGIVPQTKIILDAWNIAMYAFSLAELDLIPTQCMLLSGALTPIRIRRRQLGYFQSRLVFDIARKQVGASSAYDLEKRLCGAQFDPDIRTRWWEKIANDRLDLPRALARGDEMSLKWMRRLDEETDAARRALAMPLWRLSNPGQATVESVMAWRPTIEMLGVRIPPLPDRSVESARRYLDRLYEPRLDRRHHWAAVNVAMFCLRLAQARGSLGCYALTYDAITLGFLSPHRPTFEEPLGRLMSRLLPFYRNWFSVLELHFTVLDDLLDLVSEFRDYGFTTSELLGDPRRRTRFELPSTAHPAMLPVPRPPYLFPRHPVLAPHLGGMLASN